jgi:precorrin-6B methylase 2
MNMSSKYIIGIAALVGLVALVTSLCHKEEEKKVYSADQTRALVESLYQGVNAFSIGEHERELFKQAGSESTYGEITHEALEELIRMLDPQATDVFIDLGSGKGQAPLYMMLRTPIKKACGYELSTTRHNYARQAAEKLKQDNMLDSRCQLEFYEHDFTKPSAQFDDATIIWMNSTCYPEEVMQKMVKRLATLKPGLRVVTLKKLPDAEQHGFKLMSEHTLPMTWSKTVTTYIYKLAP